MSYSETEQRVMGADLSALKARRRQHDREFARAARKGASDDEMDELTSRSDDMWAEYEAIVDGMLRSRP